MNEFAAEMIAKERQQVAQCRAAQRREARRAADHSFVASIRMRVRAAAGLNRH